MSETDASDIGETSDNENENIDEAKSIKHSFVWDYCDIISKKDRTAMCNLCQKTLSFESTTSNIVKHLQRSHDVHRLDNNKDPIRYTDRSEAVIKKRTKPCTSPVWSYFTKLENEGRVARCNICYKKLHYTKGSFNLKRHLVLRHKEIKIEDQRKPQELIFADDVIAFEIENDGQEAEENNDVETNAVYLNEYIEKIKAAEQKPKKQKIEKEVIVNHHEPNQQPPGGNSNIISTNRSLDFFGKYLITLLEKLPEATSIKLQSEFIVKALEASADCYQEKQMLQNIGTLDNAFKITISTENNENQFEIKSKE